MLVKIIALVYLNILKKSHESIWEKAHDKILIIWTFMGGKKNMPFKIMNPQQDF